MELVKVAVMGLQEAKDLQIKLKEMSIDLVLNHNDESCTRGCKVTVEVHVNEVDLPKVAEVYQATYMKLLEGHDVNMEQINSIFDSSKEQALCPACGTSFETTLSDCPECGLVLG